MSQLRMSIPDTSESAGRPETKDATPHRTVQAAMTLILFGIQAAILEKTDKCAEAAGISWNESLQEEIVDLIEWNHFHDDQARPVFDQLIFYDWDMKENRYQIRDWRLLKNDNQVPLKDQKSGEYVSVWHDFKNRDVLRKTRSKLLRETWTQYDPELMEKDFLPEEKRKKLAAPLK